MKIVAMTLAATLGIAAQVRGAENLEHKTVTVCVESSVGFDVLPLAQQLASKMFAEAGVMIDWHHGLVGCPAQGILISISPLSDHAPADLPPNAMAYALPYEGNHIVIFYDRLKQKVKPSQTPSLLAHVLSHELTHILQGIHRHSDRGLMKATWDGADYVAMMWKPLPFTPEDIELIHRGLAARTARAASPPQEEKTETQGPLDKK
jgi:hypothetical protein